MKLDLNDIFVFAGLLIIGIGLWTHDKVLASVVVGTILFGMGIYRSIRG